MQQPFDAQGAYSPNDPPRTVSGLAQAAFIEGGGAAAPVAPDAPIWLSSTSATPQLQIDFPSALTTGDLIETQFSTDNTFATTEQDVTHTVSSGENGSSTITGTYSDLLTSATYYARARYKLGSGDWSNWSSGTSQTIIASTSAGEAIGLLLILTKAA